MAAERRNIRADPPGRVEEGCAGRNRESLSVDPERDAVSHWALLRPPQEQDRRAEREQDAGQPETLFAFRSCVDSHFPSRNGSIGRWVDEERFGVGSSELRTRYSLLRTPNSELRTPNRPRPHSHPSTLCAHPRRASPCEVRVELLSKVGEERLDRERGALPQAADRGGLHRFRKVNEKGTAPGAGSSGPRAFQDLDDLGRSDPARRALAARFLGEEARRGQGQIDHAD